MIDHEKKAEFLEKTMTQLRRFLITENQLQLLETWFAHRWDEAFNEGVAVGIKNSGNTYDLSKLSYTQAG